MKSIIPYIIFFIIKVLPVFSQINYSESFDGTTFVPDGWTYSVVSGSNSWSRVTSGTFPSQSSHSGSGEAKFDSYSVSGGVCLLITPAFDLSNAGATIPTVNFWMYRDNGYNSTADKMEVYVNTSASLSGATLLGTVNRARGLSPTVASNGWYNYSYNVPATYSTTTNYIIFKATSAFGNNIFIDDVSWTAYPAAIDMKVTSLVTPNGNFNNFGPNQSVTVQVKNTGSTALNFSSLPLTITATVGVTDLTGTTSTIAINPFIVSSGSLAVGATQNVTITTTLDMSLSGTYTFDAKTNISGDGNTANDAMNSVAVTVSRVFSYPYEEDFSSIPSPVFLVQQVSGSGNWTNINSGNMSNPTLSPVLNSGNGFAYFNSYSFGSGTVSNLITPVFDMSGLLAPSLELYVSQDKGWSGYNDKLDILISTDGGNTWSTSIKTIQRYNSSYNTPGWKRFTIQLSAYAGNPNVRIAIQATSAFGNNMGIDFLRVSGNATGLPIKLVDFKAEKYSENENKLTWITSEEINTKSFQIDRSTDGVNFETVHIHLAGGKETGSTYQYIDVIDEKAPVYYYRLTSIDFDGYSESFKIVSVERLYKEKWLTNVFPNPSEHDATIEMTIEKELEILIEITDINGTLISSNLKVLMEGSNKMEIKSEVYPTGVYFIKISSPIDQSTLANLKLVKI